MSFDVDIAALIPNENQVVPERLEAVQTRLVALLRNQYPDIDVSPNSVFYDNVLRPASYIVAGSEQAIDCVLSDLDLSNIVAGEICNCDFVRAYLKTLGASINNDIPSIATVRLSYSTDISHTVQNSARFVFAEDVVLRPLTALAGDISLIPSGSLTENKGANIYRLNAAVDGSYFADIPVYGASEAELDAAGSSGTTDVSDVDLVSVSLVSPVVPFTDPETIQELAQRAQVAFPSSSLTTRSSAVSFFNHKFSNLAGVSAVMPGDDEMTRGGTNLFGVQRNAVDIFPKGKSFVKSGTAVIPVVKDLTNNRWVGRLTLPHIPIQIRSFATLSGLTLSTNQIVGASTNSAFPGLSGAFSQYEELGVDIPADGGVLDAAITIGNVPTAFDPSVVYNASIGSGTATVTDGVADNGFIGNVFTASPSMNLKVIDTDGGTTFTVENLDTGEQVTGVTLNVGNLDMTTGDKPYLLERWLNGLTVAIAGTALNSEIPIDFEGEQGRVVVTYDYDPFVNESAQLLQHEALTGAFDIAVLAPRPLILSKLKVEYRTELGRWVDTGLALGELDAYVNQAIYPENLEDSRISDILLFAGAKGVRSITKTGVLYATLATKYSTDRMDELAGGAAYLLGDGSPGGYTAYTALSWVNEPSVSAVALDNGANKQVIGARNVQYVLDTSNITLVEYRN